MGPGLRSVFSLLPGDPGKAQACVQLKAERKWDSSSPFLESSMPDRQRALWPWMAGNAGRRGARSPQHPTLGVAYLPHLQLGVEDAVVSGN